MDRQQERIYSCDNLIFATGAWTPNVLTHVEALNFKPQLYTTQTAISFLNISNGPKKPTSRTAITIPVDLLHDQSTRLPLPGNGTQIIIPRLRTSNLHLSTSPHASSLRNPPTANPNSLSISAASTLRFPASQYLIRKYYNPLKHVLNTGSVPTCTLSDGLPLIAKVSSSALGDRHGLFDASPHGVFVAFGFGGRDLSLCLGVAKVVAGMVVGGDAAQQVQEQGVQLEKFGFRNWRLGIENGASRWMNVHVKGDATPAPSGHVDNNGAGVEKTTKDLADLKIKKRKTRSVSFAQPRAVDNEASRTVEEAEIENTLESIFGDDVDLYRERKSKRIKGMAAE